MDFRYCHLKNRFPSGFRTSDFLKDMGRIGKKNPVPHPGRIYVEGKIIDSKVIFDGIC